VTNYDEIAHDWLARLLFCDCEVAIPSPPPEEGALLDLLVREDVAPLVYYNLIKRGEAHGLTRETITSLRDLFFLDLARNLRIRWEMAKILSALAEQQIPHIILKGLALLACYYPHPALRRMTDVDLLVRSIDLPRLDGYLTTIGYRPVDAPLAKVGTVPSGYLSSREYHAPDVRPPLHIHWELMNSSTPRAAPITYPLADLWNSARKITLDGTAGWIPSGEHMLLHLTEHGLRVNHTFNRLILLYDLYLVVSDKQNPIDWKKTMALAEQSGLIPFLAFGLKHLEMWKGDVIPGYMSSHLPSPVGILQRCYAWCIRKDLRLRGLSYLLHLSLARGMSGRLHFLWRTLFPPLTIGRQRLREPNAYPALLVYGRRLREVIATLWQILKRVFIRAGDSVATGRDKSSRD